MEANDKLPESKKLKLLRLYGKTHEKMDFPGPYTAQGYLPSHSKGEERCLENFRKDALHNIIRKDTDAHKLTDLEHIQWRHLKNMLQWRKDLNGMENLLQWRKDLNGMEKEFEDMEDEDTVPAPAMIVKHRNLIHGLEQAFIGGKHDIILATCNECAGQRLLRLKKTDRIAQVIVDECGMAHEPETIAAVSLSNHVVLIGDHKQLQPVIKYTAARENGLSTSLFQRYADNFEEDCPLVTLEIQYRMVSTCETNAIILHSASIA